MLIRQKQTYKLCTANITSVSTNNHRYNRCQIIEIQRKDTFRMMIPFPEHLLLICVLDTTIDRN